jgi:hypothetical protein
MDGFLLGVFVFFGVAVHAILSTQKRASLLFPLLAFVALSAALCIIQAYVMSLPQGGSDARKFERIAIYWSSYGFWGVLDFYTGPDSYFLTWVVAVVFSVTGPSSLLANSLSLVFSYVAIRAGIASAGLAWGREAEKNSAWMLCLFPTLLLHSAIMLREAYVAAFFALGVYAIIRWRQSLSIWWFVAAQAAFVCTIYFQGAMVVANLALAIYALLLWSRKMLIALSQRRDALVYMALIAAIAVGTSAVFMSELRLPKVGEMSQYFDSDSAVDQLTQRSREAQGGAAHPSWTLINSNAELLPKLPIRVTYFLFSPFVWDVRSPYHVIGLVDSVLYMTLAFIIFRKRRLLAEKPELLAVLFVTSVSLVMFSLGVTNFGTGIRHRAKFVIGLIVIAAGLLPQLRWGSSVLLGGRPPPSRAWKGGGAAAGGAEIRVR